MANQTDGGSFAPMPEREEPNLDHVRDALRDHDERQRTEREDDERADEEPPEEEAGEDE